MNNQQEVAARLALWRMPGIGPTVFRQLLRRAGSAQQLLHSKDQAPLPDDWLKLIKKPDWQKVEADLRWLEASDHHLLWALDCEMMGMPTIPPTLSAISQAPPLLFVKGDVACLGFKQIAMVGSRKPTAYGLSIGYELATQLASFGIVITSGLALGIDSQCQRGALRVGGKSIAVLAVGLDAVYPKQHVALAEELLSAGGALVSEFSIGTKPQPQNFPRRNRLISGLSEGVVVVEAALKSGSLITARLAADQGREVFAVPGSVRQVTFQGCHALIKEGAYLVESVADIQAVLPALFLEAVQPLSPVAKSALEPLTELERQLLAVMEETPLAFAEIHYRFPLNAAELNGLLTRLLLKGYLSQALEGYSVIV